MRSPQSLLPLMKKLYIKEVRARDGEDGEGENMMNSIEKKDSQDSLELKQKAEEISKANRINLLNLILKDLLPEDRECFHRIRSSLLAFRENSFEGHRDDYKRIISYPEELQSKMLRFFESLGLGDYFKANLTKTR